MTYPLFFHAQFKASKLGKTGLLDVVFSINQITRSSGAQSLIVNAGAATEGIGGIYHYRYATGDLSLYDYQGFAHSDDATVDDKEPATLWTRWEEGSKVEIALLDAAITSRAVAGDAMALTGAERISVGTAVWATTVRTLTSLSALVASVAAAVWAYATRTLTSTAAATTAAVTGSALTIVKGRTYDATITGLTIPAAWTAVRLTVKDDPADADSLSRLQLVVSNPAAAATDGVLYVERAAATVAQRLYGSLVVNQAAGTVAFHFYDDLTAVMERISGIKWDLTVYSPDGAETESLQLTRGAWDVELTETAALA